MSLLCGICHLFILAGTIRAEGAGLETGTGQSPPVRLAQAIPAGSSPPYYEPTIKKIIKAEQPKNITNA